MTRRAPLVLLLAALALVSCKKQHSEPPAPVKYVTTSTRAWKLNVGYSNRPFVEYFGEVAIGVTCAPMGTSASSANTIQMLVANNGTEYRVVDRMKVTPASGTVRPLILYGICQPETSQCPPLPPPETKTVSCPEGYAGTWQQTRSYTSASPPTCSVPGQWIPQNPPPGACTAIPQGHVNLPVICTDPAMESRPLKDCPWSKQLFDVATMASLVRACPDESVCTFETSSWRKLGTLSAPLLVEVCGKAKEAPAPVQGGECGDGNNAWALMKHVTPSDVAGYVAPPPVDDLTAELTWRQPLRDVNGAELKGLAGFTILYGKQSGVYLHTLMIDDPRATSYRFQMLPAGRYYFAMKARSIYNGESDISNEVSKTIK